MVYHFSTGVAGFSVGSEKPAGFFRVRCEHPRRQGTIVNLTVSLSSLRLVRPVVWWLSLLLVFSAVVAEVSSIVFEARRHPHPVFFDCHKGRLVPERAAHFPRFGVLLLFVCLFFFYPAERNKRSRFVLLVRGGRQTRRGPQGLQ